MNISKKDFFQAQININKIGEEGLAKLQKTHIVVIGTGGLGSIALEVLSRMGIGHLTIIDDDQVSISNLSRQTLYTTKDIGRPKVEVAHQKLEAINPWIKISCHQHRIDWNNIATLISAANLVLDCTDNFQTKFIVHDHCYKNQMDLIQASVFQFEGRLLNFFFSDPSSNLPCLRCLYPDPPSDLCYGSCSQTGIVSSTVSLFGTFQAHEGIKRILGQPGIKQGETFFFDLETMGSHLFQWKKNSNCPLCSDNRLEEVMVKQVEKIHPHDIVFATSDVSTDRFPIEKRIDIENYQKFDWEKSINQDKNYILVCQKGLRSYEMAYFLTKQGFKNIASLKGGIASYR